MTRNFVTLLLLAGFVGSGCSSSSPSVDGNDGGSGGGTGGNGPNELPRPPVIGGGDGLCFAKERFVSTCEWAAAAKRIVWAKVKDFELTTEPSYFFDRTPPILATECDAVSPAGRLTLTVLEDLQGTGSDEVEVLIGANQINGMNPAPRLDGNGNLYWAGQRYPGLVVDQEFGLALHQPEGSDQWFLRYEQFLPLDENGRLAGRFDDECALHMPEVLSGGTLQDLREELEECEGSNAEPWLDELSVDDIAYYGAADCSKGTPAMGGAGGDSGVP